MNYRVRHTTTHDYSDVVAIGHNIAHLTPRDTAFQTVLVSDLTVEPEPAVCSTRQDFHGNRTSFFTVQEPHTRLTVHLESEVRVRKPLVFLPELTHRWEVARTMIRTDLSPAGLEAMEFAFPSPFVPVLREAEEYARPSFPEGRPILAGLLDLNQRIHKDFKYKPLATTISTPVAEVMRLRQGVCQDFAHLMLSCIRSMGLAARYISGYLLTRRPANSPRLIGADASHAWVSAYIPGHGWTDLDPTNNSIPSDEHITLAWGRDYADVSPLRGVILGGGTQTLNVAVDVSPI